MTRKQMRNSRERDPTPPSLLIAAHCSTIRRKAKRLDTIELSAILNDLVRELNNQTLRLTTYLNSLNEVVKILNSTLPPTLLDLSSHYFFILIRNTIRNLLQQLLISKQLNGQEIYVLRNCVLLVQHLVEKINDVSKVLHWITDATFLDALANCLNKIQKISKKDRNKHAIKQITRLLNIFCNIQEYLPLDLHKTLFVRLLQPTIDCLTSSNYVKLFQNFQSNANSLTVDQKLILIKCPYFLTTYNGPHIEKAIEQILEVMLPRYVSILDKHMKTIKEWKRPIMRSIHNLIITVVYAEGFFSSYSKTESFRSLINHLLNILNEPTLISKIHPNANNIETLLIDATLVVFNVLVYESDALDYIKQCQPMDIFRQLTKTPYETIVLNAYMMLAYTMDDTDIKTSPDDLNQLLSTTFNLLQKTIETRQQMSIDQNSNRENIDRNILQLLETLKGLAQYEQIRNEIFKQNILPFIIDSYSKLYGLSRQILLECLWKLSFNEQITQQLREHPNFILSLENIPKPVNDNSSQNTLRRSASYSSRRNSMSVILTEATNYEIQKVVDGLLWKVVKEPQFREKILEKRNKPIETNPPDDQQKYTYDIMISYCYADRDIVYRIQRFLINEGYHIWFDPDLNHGQATEIVAKAIENSEFVIICMSDSYKRDSHSQAEAEYALISKRPLFPLIVHSSYKPDGWLSAIISNNIYIDFGTSNFKAASELLLKEIKQRQNKREIVDAKPTISASVNIIHNPSIPLTVSDRPYISGESSAVSGSTSSAGSSVPSTIVNNQQQTSTRSISRPPTPGTDISATSVLIDRQQQQQQQQQGSVRPTSRPPTPGSIYTVAPIIPVKQQQQAPKHPISRSSTPGTAPPTISTAGTQQQQAPGYSVSRSSTAGTAPSSISTMVIQQQQAPGYPVSRSSTPGTAPPTISTAGTQQQQAPGYPVARSSTSGTAPSTISTMVIQQQQAPGYSVSRSSTPGSITASTPVFGDKLPQQTSIPTIARSPTSNSISSAISVIVDKHQQQQQTTERPILRSSTPSSISSDASVTTGKQWQQTSVYAVSGSLVSSASASTTSSVVEKEQQKTSMKSVSQSPIPGTKTATASIVTSKQPPQEPVHSNSQPPLSASASSATTRDLDKQQQPTALHSNLKSSTPVTFPADTSVNIEKKQQQQPAHPVTESLTNGSAPSTPSVAVNKAQEQQIRIHVVSESPTPSYTSSDESVNRGKEQQQKVPVQPVLQAPMTNAVFPATSPVVVAAPQQHHISGQSNSKAIVSDPVHPVASVTDNKQQQQEQRATFYSTSQPPVRDTDASTVSYTVDKLQRQTSVHSTPTSSIAATGPSATSVDIEKQPQRTLSRSNSRPTTPASNPLPKSTDVEKQQQQRILSRSNSASTASAAVPVASSINSVLLASSQTNGREQSRLLEQYTNRKTHNSIYRTLSMNAWRNNDVLDFLFDINLYTMMPLCESMSGKALLQLFRMCQRKPSRLYDQLNEELRARFKQLTLPMGVYTQFLIEMDALVGPLPDALPPIPNPTSKILERVILMPPPIQQQPISIQPSPRPSIHPITSANQSKTITPVESVLETRTPRNKRIVERAVYRPASNIGRPYNFIIESVEEPTVLLDQVQRYGNHILLLDQTASQHRQLNTFR